MTSSLVRRTFRLQGRPCRFIQGQKVRASRVTSETFIAAGKRSELPADSGSPPLQPSCVEGGEEKIAIGEIRGWNEIRCEFHTEAPAKLKAPLDFNTVGPTGPTFPPRRLVDKRT